MVLRFIEGFDMDSATSATTDLYYDRKFAVASGTPNSASGLRAGFSISSNSYKFTTPEYTDNGTWIIHWAWFFDSGIAVTSQEAGITLYRGGVEQLRLRLRSHLAVENGNRYVIDVYRGATLLGTSPAFFADKWHTFEFKVDVHITTGSYELKANGTSVLSDAGPTNTADTGSSDADAFEFSCDNGGNVMRLDHVIVADDTGATNNDFFGESMVLYALPDAVGDDSDWVASGGGAREALVNNGPIISNIATNDATRITSETVNDEDRFSYDDLLTTWGIPNATTLLGLQVESMVSMEASGTRDIRATFKDTGGTATTGTSAAVLGTSWVTEMQMWETNPVTAVAWTASSVNDGQFGIKVQA